jgi:amino acid transporter
MKTFLKRFLAGLLIGVCGVAMAYTAATYVAYVGYNPATGQVGQPAVTINTGAVPVLDATTSLGGAALVQFTANTTTCTLVLDFQTQAPNGYFCVASDETTPADSMKQSAHNTSSCTITGTVVSADKILIEVNGF